jgi:hypothetical protein
MWQGGLLVRVPFEEFSRPCVPDLDLSRMARVFHSADEEQFARLDSDLES